MLLGALDGLIVGTAMPQVVGELGGVDRLSWVVTAYMLAIAVSTPVWGKLGDMFGRKGAFTVTVVVFVTGSMLCGAAQDMNQLIAFRLLQGVGGGGLMVGALALVGTLIPPREQGRFQGFMSAVMGLAMVGGPLVGGVVTDHFGWRWCFYVNLPVGALALLLIAGLRLPRSPRTGARVDYPGALLLAVAISAVVLLTTWGGKEYAWTSPMLSGLVAVGVAACVALLVVERRAAAPMVPLSLFKSANFSLITLVGMLLGAVMTSAVTFLPILGQSAGGASATGSGLLLLPMFAAQVAVGLVAGRFITATGTYKIVVLVGGVFMVLGTLSLGTAGAGAGQLVQSACMAALGVGIGLLTQTTVLLSLQSSPVEDLGAASATATLARTLGGSLGVAVSGSFFARALGDAVPVGGGAPRSEGGATLDPAVLEGLSGAARAAYQRAVLDGTTHVFLFTAVLAALALAAAFLLKEVPLRGAPIGEGDPPDENGTPHASASGTKEMP
jgi:EmrB/QacA subfamily drug resistance transporter